MVIAARLGYPMIDVALVTYHVDINEGVRIDELESCYSPLYDSQILHVKRPLPVMCGQRAREHKKAKKHAQEREQLIFQEAPRELTRIIASSSTISQRSSVRR